MQNDPYISTPQFVFADPKTPKHRYLPSKRKKTSKTNCYVEMYFGGLGTFPRYLRSFLAQTSKVPFDITTFPRPTFHTYISISSLFTVKTTTCMFESISLYVLVCMFQIGCIFENHGKY